MKSFNIIVAFDSKRGIGKNGKLPWKMPGDLKHFKDITCKTVSGDKQNAVIMGRKTWESLPEQFRPLPGRVNIVITKNDKLNLPQGVLRVSSLDMAFEILESSDLQSKIGGVFVIGGGSVFFDAINKPQCKKIYATHILSEFDCDVFFPEFQDTFSLTASSSHQSEQSTEYYFAEYKQSAFSQNNSQ